MSMWFMLPEGCGGITVECQEFGVEVKDKAGRGYFRAPNHFAPRILANRGFVALETPPEDFPDDLPKADPLRDNAIADLTKNASAMKIEMANLRSDLGACNAKVLALTNTNSALQAKLVEKDNIIEGLREEIEDKPQALPSPKAVGR